MRSPTSVDRTISAFNFIRRIGFPHTPELVSGLVALCFLATILSVGQSIPYLWGIFQLATLGLAIPIILGAALNAALILSRDKVLDFRRLLGVDLVSLLLLTFSMTVSAIIGLLVAVPTLWFQGFLLGVAASLPIRFLTTMSMSSQRAWRKVFAAILPPLLIVRGFAGTTVQLLPTIYNATFSLRIEVFLIFVILLSLTGAWRIIRKVEHAGSIELRDSPMELFRAFLGHWLTNTPEALEARLKPLGDERAIETKILGFSDDQLKPVGSIIVSNFHPGPYRDLGSAGLPSKLKEFMTGKVGGIVHVPHGISNHELNIVSREDINKLLEAARVNHPSNHSIHRSSVVIRRSIGEAMVTGQALSKLALLTISLAPADMEDIPEAVLREIETVASRNGFETIAIDAHNSISGQAAMTALQSQAIVRAATEVLESLRNEIQVPFSVGAADDPLADFRLEDGIGPGGVSVLVVRIGQQSAAYITIDGNNMETGFREMIVQSLRPMDISESEVMTTDTHLVTGLVRSPLGYYPIGSHISKESLLNRIDQTVGMALSRMRPGSAGFSSFSLKLGVLGIGTFQSITGFVARVGRQIGRSFVRLETSTVLGGILLLYLVYML
ncbi:MAG TPA: DUF2070 family protein [Candidatus Bathyarchaeia archaeon]|nr:DUF2070 family protein [Candidatus Bathyarchaeia archaeon]